MVKLLKALYLEYELTIENYYLMLFWVLVKTTFNISRNSTFKIKTKDYQLKNLLMNSGKYYQAFSQWIIKNSLLMQKQKLQN